MKNINKIFAIAIVALGFSTSALAQVTATATASGKIVTPIAIVNQANMNFGDIAVQAGVAGTVVMDPQSSRTPSAGLSLPAAATFSAAIFKVTGLAGYTYSITIPTASISTTTNPSLATPMTVSNWTSNPATTAGSGTGLLDGAGEQLLKVGATLNLNAGQLAGAYSTDAFSVTVNYN